MIRPRQLAVAAALVATFVVATPVFAASSTIHIGKPTLAAKVLVTVPVNVTCQPINGDTALDLGGMSTTTLQVIQANGKQVANASDFMFGPVTCDGTTVNHLVFQVIATTVPYHHGSAVVQLKLDIEDPNSCCTTPDNATVTKVVTL